MNPMSAALKARRMGSVAAPKPEMPGGMGDGKDPLMGMLASLDDESKLKLKQMLDQELAEKAPEEGESAGVEMDQHMKPPVDGESPITEGEQEAISDELSPEVIQDAQNIFKKQGSSLGDKDPVGQKTRGLGDRFKANMHKHFSK